MRKAGAGSQVRKNKINFFRTIRFQKSQRRSNVVFFTRPISLAHAGGPERIPFKDEKMNFSIFPSQLCLHTPSALNAGAKRSGATCHMAMPQCCYLAKGAK